MTFEEFLRRLPQVNPSDHPIRDEVKAWADYQTAPNPRFLAPPLRENRPTQLGQTSVVILSAPGAVGKSTVGKEIARQTGAPLVNLAALKVGSHGASGLIVDMFGPGGVASAFGDLSNGDLFLVFDSLDETRLGSGEANFDAFLDNLSTLFRDHRRNPVVLLLARIDTAEWVEIYLEEKGVPIAQYSIDFFEESQAGEFVVRYANDRTMTDSLPFQQALDGLLTALRSAVSGQPESGGLIRSVLGYAPVLEAVGRYLLDAENRRNYHRLVQTLQSNASEWDLLLQVAEALLAREHEKVVEQSRQNLSHLAASWSDWQLLYTPQEQILRLLALRFNLDQPTLPQELPVGLRGSYGQLVRRALDEHPFHGAVDGLHPVFGEYLYARLFGGTPELPASLRDQGRDVLRVSGSYLPTRSLGRFVLALTSRDGRAQVSSRDLGFIYESLLADQERPGDVSLELRSEGDNHRASVEIHSRALDFDVTDGSSAIWFWRRLAYSSLFASVDIQLGFPGGEFRLGPAVYVECATFRCPAELGVYFGSSTDEEVVALVAKQFERMPRAPLVRGTRLYVRGDAVPWPWSDYEETEPPPANATVEIINAYNHLARMLLWLRAEGYGEIARVDDLMETAASGPTAVAARLLRFCVDRGLFQKQDRLYRLSDDVAARYGINYVDLKRRILKQPVIELMSDFLMQR